MTHPRTLPLSCVALFVALLAFASCSGGEVTFSSGDDPSPALELSDADRTIADQWGFELGRNGTRIGSVTVIEGRCIAAGMVSVLGSATAQDELDTKRESNAVSTTKFDAGDADAMANHWADCVDLTDYFTDLGAEIAPFAVAGDLSCFATEMNTRAAPLISSVLQGDDPVGTISAGAAQECGLL